jgi:hypothetical protein
MVSREGAKGAKVFEEDDANYFARVLKQRFVFSSFAPSRETKTFSRVEPFDRSAG